MNLSKEELIRYSRQILIPEIGEEGQAKLKDAKVLVVGAGGLGCPALIYLAAAGVGMLGIVDGDAVDESNLQRQILYTKEDIGKAKVLIAEKKIKQLNPFIETKIYKSYIDSDNALSILKDWDIIVVGTDDFASRYLINDACVILNKPFVLGAVYQFEGQMSVFNYKDGPTYRCMYQDQPPAGEIPDCSTAGVLASLPGLIGTMQATETIKIITGAGAVLSGKIFIINGLDMETAYLYIQTNPQNKKIKKIQAVEYLCNSIIELDYKSLKELMQNNSDIQLVDVRQDFEYKRNNIGGINLPLSVLPVQYIKLDKERPVVLYCNSGNRSRTAAALLLRKGFKKIYNLKEGINHIH